MFAENRRYIESGLNLLELEQKLSDAYLLMMSGGLYLSSRQSIVEDICNVYERVYPIIQLYLNKKGTAESKKDWQLREDIALARIAVAYSIAGLAFPSLASLAIAKADALSGPEKEPAVRVLAYR